MTSFGSLKHRLARIEEHVDAEPVRSSGFAGELCETIPLLSSADRDALRDVLVRWPELEGGVFDPEQLSDADLETLRRVFQAGIVRRGSGPADQPSTKGKP